MATACLVGSAESCVERKPLRHANRLRASQLAENKATAFRAEHHIFSQEQDRCFERAWLKSKRGGGITAENMVVLLRSWHVRGIPSDDRDAEDLCAEWIDRRLDRAEGELAINDSCDEWKRAERRRVATERMGALKVEA